MTNDENVTFDFTGLFLQKDKVSLNILFLQTDLQRILIDYELSKSVQDKTAPPRYCFDYLNIISSYLRSFPKPHLQKSLKS